MQPTATPLAAARAALATATARLEAAADQAAHRLARSDFNAAFDRLHQLELQRPTTRPIHF